MLKECVGNSYLVESIDSIQIITILFSQRREPLMLKECVGNSYLVESINSIHLALLFFLCVCVCVESLIVPFTYKMSITVFKIIDYNNKKKSCLNFWEVIES